MAFYDKHKKKPSGGKGQKSADDRRHDEHTARRAHGPADRRRDEEMGRPRWMDEEAGQNRPDFRGGGPREGYSGPRHGGPGGPGRGPRDSGGQGPRGYGRPPQGGRDFGRPQGPREYGGRPQGPREYGGRPQGPREYGGRPQGPRDFSARPPRMREEQESEAQGYSLEELETMIRRVVRQEIERYFSEER